MAEKTEDKKVKRWIEYLSTVDATGEVRWRTEKDLQKEFGMYWGKIKAYVDDLKDLDYEIEEEWETPRRTGYGIMDTVDMRRIWATLNLGVKRERTFLEKDAVNEVLAIIKDMSWLRLNKTALETEKIMAAKYGRPGVSLDTQCKDFRSIYRWKKRGFVTADLEKTKERINRYLFTVKMYRAPLVDIVQYLGNLSYRCDSPKDDARKLEVRIIAELTREDLEHERTREKKWKDHIALLREYLSELGYDLVDTCKKKDEQFGVFEFEEFTLNQYEAKEREFTLYMEIWDHDNRVLKDFRIFDGIKLNWLEVGTISDLIEGLFEKVTKIKGAKRYRLEAKEKHIWDLKGVKRPEGLKGYIGELDEATEPPNKEKINGYIPDGAGISSTISKITLILHAHSQLGAETDFPTEFKKLKKLLNFEYLAGPGHVELFESCRKNGYHFTSPKLKPTSLNARMWLGDCEGRLFYAINRGILPDIIDDVLFSEKVVCGKRYVRTPIDRSNLLCLPFYSGNVPLRRQQKKRRYLKNA